MLRKLVLFILGVFIFSSCHTFKVEDVMEKEIENEKKEVILAQKEEVEKAEEEEREHEEEQEELRREIIESNDYAEIFAKQEMLDYIDVEPVIIEKNRYVVVSDKNLPENIKKLKGKDAVHDSLKSSVIELEDYVNGTSFFDYDENVQFPIFTKQLALTTIIFGNDEMMSEGSAPYMSDTTRWEITGDVWETDKGARQLIMVKPKSSGLETNMMVITNKRLYHFVLYSTTKDYQPMVQFRYPTERPFITAHKKKVVPKVAKNHFEELDMKYVSFNYKVSVPIFQKKVEWVPTRVYDDGSHTYIVFPEIIMQKEYPSVWEEKDEITNFEHHPDYHNMLIINKLVNKLTLRLGKEKVVITKLKGKPKELDVVVKR